MVSKVEILRISPQKKSFSIRVSLPRRIFIRLSVGRTRISARNPPIPLTHLRVAQFQKNLSYPLLFIRLQWGTLFPPRQPRLQDNRLQKAQQRLYRPKMQAPYRSEFLQEASYHAFAPIPRYGFRHTDE